MTRTKMLGVALATALTMATTTLSAEAAPAKVTMKQLPTVAQVGKIVPALKGGQVVDMAERAVERPGARCGASKRVKAASGRMATYLPKFDVDNDPNEMAARSVLVHTVRFANTKQAKQVLDGYTRMTKKCLGKMDGADARRLALPKLGDQRAGYTITGLAEMMDEAPNDPNNGELSAVNLPNNAAFIISRKGKTVVQVWQFTPKKPKKAQPIKLTRLALKRAS